MQAHALLITSLLEGFQWITFMYLKYLISREPRLKWPCEQVSVDQWQEQSQIFIAD